jgi:hypothetical protein
MRLRDSQGASTLSNWVPAVRTHKGRVQAAMLALLAWFSLSWPIGALVDWEEVSHHELPYLVADLSVLAPLSACTYWGLAKMQSWAPLLALVVIGAFAYDAVNFLTFVARDRLLGLPAALPIVLIPIAIAVMAYLIRAEISQLLSSADVATSPRSERATSRG